MRPTLLFLLFVLGTISPSSRAVEIPPPEDRLSDAFTEAANGLVKGESRAKVLEGLTAALERNQERPSYYLELTRSLAADLRDSARKSPNPADPKDIAAAPSKHLRETKLPIHILSFRENWSGALRWYVKEYPNDPVSLLVAKDRSVIAELIPLLGDRTPTRSFRVPISAAERLHVPRVCDFALLLIEYHSLCKFLDIQTAQLLHHVPDADRGRVAKRIAEWWSENKTKSVAAGIRDQLGRAGFYGDLRMALILIELGEKGTAEDREVGLNRLRELTRYNVGNYSGSQAGRLLVRYDRQGAIDIFYEALKPMAAEPERQITGGGVSFLADYGGRREWELLHSITTGEIKVGKQYWQAPAFRFLVGPFPSSPYKIPILAFALSQAGPIVKRQEIEGMIRDYSPADLAAESLQKLTGWT